MELKELLKKTRDALAAKKAAQAKAAAGGKSKTPTVNKGIPAVALKKLSSFGVRSFNDLIKINTAAKKYAYMPKEDLQAVKQLKEDVDTCMLMSKIFKKPIQELDYFKNNLAFAMKAFGITGGSEGFEWIPTGVADSYIDEFNLERKVSGLFMEVKMPTNPFNWPVLSGGAIARKVGVASAINKQVFDTDSTIQFNAKKLASRYELPEELNEDAAPDIIKAIRQELMEGQEKAMEIAILEGDTAGTMHHFSQLPDVAGSTTIASITTETPETLFDGIRVRVLAAHALVAGSSVVDAGASTISETELGSCRGKLGKFGVDPSQVAIISGVKVYNQLVQLDDVRTLEQYGGQATVISGELAKYEGMPVIVSEYLREDTHSTGKNTSTGAQNIKGSLMMVNRKRWWTGLRRPIQVKVENNKTEYDVLDLVSFSRRAFQAVLKADGTNYATESSAAMVINIGL